MCVFPFGRMTTVNMPGQLKFLNSLYIMPWVPQSCAFSTTCIRAVALHSQDSFAWTPFKPLASFFLVPSRQDARAEGGLSLSTDTQDWNFGTTAHPSLRRMPPPPKERTYLSTPIGGKTALRSKSVLNQMPKPSRLWNRRKSVQFVRIPRALIRCVPDQLKRDRARESLSFPFRSTMRAGVLTMVNFSL